MTTFRPVIEPIGAALDLLGVILILSGTIFAIARTLYRRHAGAIDLYRPLRQDLGRAILLGLEFLVAGDIIRTVAVDPNLENVAALGGIVLIRTFLSMSLQLELEGRWPWQRAGENRPTSSGAA